MAEHLPRVSKAPCLTPVLEMKIIIICLTIGKKLSCGDLKHTLHSRFAAAREAPLEHSHRHLQRLAGPPTLSQATAAGVTTMEGSRERGSTLGVWKPNHGGNEEANVAHLDAAHPPGQVTLSPPSLCSYLSAQPCPDFRSPFHSNNSNIRCCLAQPLNEPVPSLPRLKPGRCGN